MMRRAEPYFLMLNSLHLRSTVSSRFCRPLTFLSSSTLPLLTPAHFAPLDPFLCITLYLLPRLQQSSLPVINNRPQYNTRSNQRLCFHVCQELQLPTICSGTESKQFSHRTNVMFYIDQGSGFETRSKNDFAATLY